jgi:hypothetical protein
MYDGTLWMGSWETNRVYAIDPATWRVTAEFEAPGTPFGLARLGDELRAVISLGDDDDRYLFRFKPGSGFDLDSKTACPEMTGSHLAVHGNTLFLGQMHNRRILVMDGDYAISREIALPTRSGGFGFAGDTLHFISADDEFEKLQFGTLDVSQQAPPFVPLADLELDVRSLAFDGEAWWTSHREANEIVAFTV